MRKWWYVALSILLLAPVYWQPRVQAGDLSSHIYNAWLSQLIEAGRTQGLVIVSQTTNILFDLMLGGLFRVVGAEVRAADFGFHRGAGVRVGSASASSPWSAAAARGICCPASPCWPMAGSSTWASSIST